MIKCKIISVRIEVSNPKYKIRNKIIDDLIISQDIKGFDIQISNAVTPSDWELVNDDYCRYQNKLFKLNRRLGHTHGITNFLSHYKIWIDKEPVLILEDDLIYNKSIFEKSEHLIEKFNKIPIPNKLLYLQSSCPWRPGFPDKNYNKLIDFGEFYALPTDTFIDLSGTSSYYIYVDDLLMMDLTREIGATDGIFDNLHREKKLVYFIPKDWKNYFKLNKDVQ